MNIIVNLLTSIDVTEVVVALIGFLSIVITTVVFPLIKSKLTNSSWETIKNYAWLVCRLQRFLIGAGNGSRNSRRPSSILKTMCSS